MSDRSSNEVIVEGEVERITFESADGAFRVIRFACDSDRRSMTLVGALPRVSPGSRLRVRGNVQYDRRHGEQIKVSSVTELAPSTLAGLERYLGSGMIKGVGEVYAKRIVSTFGMETLRILDEEPERLTEVEGLGSRRSDSIIAAWSEQRAIRDVMLFLQSHDVSPSLATRIWKRYGARAVSIVSSDPYRLSLDVWGVGFKTADRIAMSLGIKPDSPARLQSAALQALHDISESGHCLATLDGLVRHALDLLGFDAEDAVNQERLVHAIDALEGGGHIVSETSTGGEKLVFPKELYLAEQSLSERLAKLALTITSKLTGAERAIDEFERTTRVPLSDEQRHAVETAAGCRVMVVTGGPGVGKTTVVRAILAVFEDAGLDVRLAAPTGRAAKRMSETTGREAVTLHRLLEFDPKTAEFRRNSERPIETGALIVDEASMIDLSLGSSLFSAVGDARVVLVGDVDQLPSVGPGAVLRDVIESDTIERVRLTRIFRQAEESLIVRNAHRINRGEPPEVPASGTMNADFYLIDRRDPESARDTLIEIVTKRIPNRFGFDPVRDVQVLSPMHKGPAGAIALNEALQSALNPGEGGVRKGAKSFRVGDKVMQLRNDYDRNVWNGDVGIVLRIDYENEQLVVGFDPQGHHQGNAATSAVYEREVVYENSMLDEISLAYASTVHKSQGSEYPVVVIPFLTSHFVMLSKNLLYTAVTRGKKLVVLVADPRALSIALAEDRRDDRRTRLKERLRFLVRRGEQRQHQHCEV